MNPSDAVDPLDSLSLWKSLQEWTSSATGTHYKTAVFGKFESLNQLDCCYVAMHWQCTGVVDTDSYLLQKLSQRV